MAKSVVIVTSSLILLTLCVVTINARIRNDEILMGPRHTWCLRVCNPRSCRKGRFNARVLCRCYPWLPKVNANDLGRDDAHYESSESQRENESSPDT